MMQLVEKYRGSLGDIESLHPFQQQGIQKVLGGDNCLVIAPTGKGKSLIYQIAGQELPGTTIVVSPLVALINEQAEILGEELAISISSGMSFSDQRQLLRDIAAGVVNPKFIFVSPERLQNYFFRSALRKSKLGISLVVIDEAHCISQWGSDFRPEYSQISNFIDFLKSQSQSPTILAMTATISEAARHDIMSEFGIAESSVVIDSDIIRKELELNFIKVDEEKAKYGQILELLTLHNPQKVIIYFYDIGNCKSFARRLNQDGISSRSFYSEMHGEDKDENYWLFKNGEIRVLCATTAFGMGMNIPDIDMVLHHRMPNSIEEYYQQVGRAARDKRICPTAKCFLLWSEANFEFKYEEHLPNVCIQQEHIDDVFKRLGLTGNAGKAQSLEYSDYIKQKIGRIRYLLEKEGVLHIIGEINGTPLSIKFNSDNPHWDKIVERMDFGNSFIRASENSNIELQDLIDYVFTEELSGNIKKFPAREKKIFFRSPFDEVPLEIAYKIIQDSLTLYDYKEQQIIQLEELIRSADPQAYIQQYFDQAH